MKKKSAPAENYCYRAWLSGLAIGLGDLFFIVNFIIVVSLAGASNRYSRSYLRLALARLALTKSAMPMTYQSFVSGDLKA